MSFETFKVYIYILYTVFTIRNAFSILTIIIIEISLETFLTDQQCWDSAQTDNEKERFWMISKIQWFEMYDIFEGCKDLHQAYVD